MVTVQQLAEMEEVIQYFTLCSSSTREAAHNYVTHLRDMWALRLRGCQRNVDVRFHTVFFLVLLPTRVVYPLLYV